MNMGVSSPDEVSGERQLLAVVQQLPRVRGTALRWLAKASSQSQNGCHSYQHISKWELCYRPPLAVRKVRMANVLIFQHL